jgi:1-acyl-sn-glycerol-3-phosphate acyltransferase
MTLAFRVVNATIKNLTHILCRINDTSLAQVPEKGPLILVANHINFLEVPVVYTHLQPRPVTGLVKSETWDNPAMAFLFNLWGGIPLKRGEADVYAYHQALHALQEGKIIAVAPEGTRSGHGRLQRGYPGIVTLAMRSGAPLLPLVYYGNEQFRRNISHLRRTDFHIAVGRPFLISVEQVYMRREIRQAITDEIMYQLAMLLPPPYRGEYANLQLASQHYLRFLN